MSHHYLCDFSILTKEWSYDILIGRTTQDIDVLRSYRFIALSHINVEEEGMLSDFQKQRWCFWFTEQQRRNHSSRITEGS
jgi:hypothetical protein